MELPLARIVDIPARHPVGALDNCAELVCRDGETSMAAAHADAAFAAREPCCNVASIRQRDQRAFAETLLARAQCVAAMIGFAVSEPTAIQARPTESERMWAGTIAHCCRRLWRAASRPRRVLTLVLAWAKVPAPSGRLRLRLQWRSRASIRDQGQNSTTYLHDRFGMRDGRSILHYPSARTDWSRHSIAVAQH